MKRTSREKDEESTILPDEPLLQEAPTTASDTSVTSCSGNDDDEDDDNDQTTLLHPQSEKDHFHFWLEAKLLIWDLALPQTILQIGLIWASALTASFVGRRMGSIHLDGVTLGSLTGNLFVTSLLQGLFSASDTLSPQAFGAGNPRELGLLAIRGVIASWVVMCVMVALLFFQMENIFAQLHQDPVVAKLALDWFRVFSWSLPSYSVTMMMWRFLSAQSVMQPQVTVGIVVNIVVLPLALHFCMEWWGFLGSAVAITFYSTVYAASLALYLWWFQPHDPESWPGISLSTIREAMRWKPLVRFLRLGLGGMLCCSEWIYWEILVLMAGTLGVVPLSVQTIANMVIEVMFMIPVGVGIALSIRIGTTLSVSVRRAQLLSILSLVIGTICFGLLSILLYTQQELVVSVFTQEQEVLEGCKAIWWLVCVFHFNCAIYGIVMGIATGLGMQWTLGIATCLSLIVVGVPSAYYFGLAQGGGLTMIWTWINPPYMLISAVLLVSFVQTDWHAIAAEIIDREQQTTSDDSGSKEKQQKKIGYGSTDDSEPLKPLLSAPTMDSNSRV